MRLGEYDVSTTAEPLKHEEFNISDIVIHPGFNNSTLVHDIALLRLEKPAKRKQVRLSKNHYLCILQCTYCRISMWYVCLNQEISFTISIASNALLPAGEEELKVSFEGFSPWGIGVSNSFFSASEHSLVLKEIDVPLWNHDTCNGALQAQFGPAYSLPGTTLCAGAEGRDACDVSDNHKLVVEPSLINYLSRAADILLFPQYFIF